MYSCLGLMDITNGWKCSGRCLMVHKGTPAASDTRWACRHIACCNVMDRLPAIVQMLEEIAPENHTQRAVEARGILAQIDLNFAGSLVLFRKGPEWLLRRRRCLNPFGRLSKIAVLVLVLLHPNADAERVYSMVGLNKTSTTKQLVSIMTLNLLDLSRTVSNGSQRQIKKSKKVNKHLQ